MKQAYPVILSQDGKFIFVYAPDLEAYTQGEDLADAIDMARDVISLKGVIMQDKGEEIPAPSSLKDIQKESESDLLTLVDVDFDAYRKRNDMLSVRRNVTLPGWLDYEARESGINVSAVLQDALKKVLSLDGPRQGRSARGDN